jgi:hypothetical protein
MDNDMIWVTNINENPEKDSAVQSILRKKHTVGPPKATPTNFGGIATVEELQEQKIIGLYRNK